MCSIACALDTCLCIHIYNNIIASIRHGVEVRILARSMGDVEMVCSDPQPCWRVVYGVSSAKPFQWEICAAKWETVRWC